MLGLLFFGLLVQFCIEGLCKEKNVTMDIEHKPESYEDFYTD